MQQEASTPLTIMDLELLEKVTLQAQKSPRLRKNHNFHPSDEFCSHRLLNAMEPGSYIRPHCHMEETKDESIVMVRGSMGVLAFNEKGDVVLAKIIAAGGDAFAVDIPHGCFHTLVSLESRSVFFEAKAGPYRPLTEAEKAPWSPEEGTPEASIYLRNLEKLFRQ